MQKLLGVILVTCVLAYAAACIALFVFQRSLIYYPPRSALLRAPHVSQLAVPGATVLVSERPHAGPKAVVYFGGNAEDVSTSLPQLDEAFPDRALYLLHYRGYAGSTGAPTEGALVADALALLDRVAAVHADIVVIGRSLGSGIAVQAASRRTVSRLVLVTPYDSLTSLAKERFPYFPIRLLMRDSYDSGRHAPAVTAPTLLIAAQDDEIIPMTSTERLLGRFRKGMASLVVVPGATHNSIALDPAYGRLLQDKAGGR